MNKLFYFNKNNLNTCYYTQGDQHSTCTHPNYCIFNQKRTQLEKNITQLENELQQRLKDIKHIDSEGTNSTYDYNTTKKRINIIKDDLNQLKKIKKNIIKKEVKKYGYHD